MPAHERRADELCLLAPHTGTATRMSRWSEGARSIANGQQNNLKVHITAMHAFPQTEASDIDSVADALDSGLVHWVKGETAEALRCLRAASTAACDAGIDQRALDLARAAADLIPTEQASDPIEESRVRRTQPAEARRSKLPEPPAAPKKFTGSPETEHAATATSSAPSTRASSNATATSTPPSQGLSNLTKSVAKSTRPAAAVTRSTSTKAANNGSSQTVSSFPTNGLNSKPPTSVTGSSAPAAETAEQESNAISAPTTAAPQPAHAAAHKATNAVSSSKAPLNSVQPTASQETRSATRSNGLDMRLASIRVRVDRIEADGTIRLRQLDLAATASGEDNAVLVISQNLWQELKRGS